MPMLAHAIPLGEVQYSAGGRHTLEIDRSGVIGEILLRMRFTVTNGGSAAVGALWQTLATLIKRVEIVVNGKDTIWSIDGPGLVARAIYEYGNVPYGMDASVVLTGSAATAYDIVIPMPFYLPRSSNPFVTALPCDRFGQVSMIVTYGTIADFYTTVNSAAVSAVTVEAFGKYLLNVDPQQAFLARVLSMINENPSANNSSYSTLLDSGTGLRYRSVLVATLDDGVAANTIIGSGQGAKLKSGEFTFQDWKPPVLQADNKHRFNQSVAQTGVYMFNTEEMGMPLWINTDRAVMKADLRTQYDLTYISTVTTLRHYIEGIRPFNLALPNG